MEWYRTTLGRRTELVAKHRRGALERNLEWQLTDDEYADALGDGVCHYCTGPITTGGIGLDRKDSAIGYLAGNVVPCCYSCNVEKSGTISYDEYVWLWKFRNATAEAKAEVAKRRLLDGRSAALTEHTDHTWRDALDERATKRDCGLGVDDPWPAIPDAGATVFAWRQKLGITQTQASKLLIQLGQKGWNYREVQRSEHLPFVSSEDRKRIALDQSAGRAAKQAERIAGLRWRVVCAVCGEAGHNKRRHDRS